MNPPCAKCFKSVYPTEKMSILDKFWHKGCFRCTSCGMSLNLKNFKGYNKEPYCNAHYPKAEHTSIVDDPESNRLKAQTKIQSQVAYHKEFENAKGSYTSVTDDPESMRIKKNSEIQSHVQYRQDISTIGYTSVTDDPETQRLKKNSDVQSQAKYKGSGAFNMGASGDDAGPAPSAGTNYPAQKDSSIQQKVVYESQPVSRDQEKVAEMQNKAVLEKEQQRRRQIEQQQKEQEEQRLRHQEEQKRIQMEQFQKMQAEKAEKAEREQQRLQQQEEQRRFEEEQRRAEVEQKRIEAEQKRRIETEQMRQLELQTQQLELENQKNMASKIGPVYRAEYDYEPNYADPDCADELEFKEGDVIINVVPIDDGWCTGTNERTGTSGMLPRNYIVEMS